MTAHLALRKHDTRASARLIQLWTGSIYSHCELLVDGWCYSSSAMDGGVRRKQIKLDPEKWDVVRLPWVGGRQVLEFFEKTDHYRYGWTGLVLSQLFNLNRAQDKAQFCSQWCAAALRLPNPATFSPGTLAGICDFVGGLACEGITT